MQVSYQCNISDKVWIIHYVRQKPTSKQKNTYIKLFIFTQLNIIQNIHKHEVFLLPAYAQWLKRLF